MKVFLKICIWLWFLNIWLVTVKKCVCPSSQNYEKPSRSSFIRLNDLGVWQFLSLITQSDHLSSPIFIDREGDCKMELERDRVSEKMKGLCRCGIIAWVENVRKVVFSQELMRCVHQSRISALISSFALLFLISWRRYLSETHTDLYFSYLIVVFYTHTYTSTHICVFIFFFILIFSEILL